MTYLHADDVVYQMLGSTPVSSTLTGKNNVLASWMRTPWHWQKKWRIMCFDDNGGIMQDGGPTLNGDVYDQTYYEVFTIKKGKIVELHAFFDTVLVERCLFQDFLQTERDSPQKPFDF